MSVKSLTLSSLSAIPLELYSSDIHLTIYCDNIVGTVPSLRQFAALAVTNPDQTSGNQELPYSGISGLTTCAMFGLVSPRVCNLPEGPLWP